MLFTQGEKIVLPILIRFKYAPYYMGMDKNRFNREVRSHLTEVRIGKQGIAFHRLELDEFAAHYVQSNGRRISNSKEK